MPANTVDDFGGASGAAVDSTKWTTTAATFYKPNYDTNTGTVTQDGLSNLKVSIDTDDTFIPEPQDFVQTLALLPTGSWTATTAATFAATGPSASDVALGFRIEMSDGTSYGYVKFDNTGGMRLDYGNQSGSYQFGGGTGPKHVLRTGIRLGWRTN